MRSRNHMNIEYVHGMCKIVRQKKSHVNTSPVRVAAGDNVFPSPNKLRANNQRKSGKNLKKIIVRFLPAVTVTIAMDRKLYYFH